MLLLSHPRQNFIFFNFRIKKGVLRNEMLRRPASVPPNCSHPALGGGHLSALCESLASGIVDAAESCRWVFARLVARSVVSLSRAPAIPAKRRTGDSESRRINAAPPIHPCALPQKFIYNFGFSPHRGPREPRHHGPSGEALRNGPSGEAARS